MNIFQRWWHAIRHNYANFSGRARRMDYWSFVLVGFLWTLVIGTPKNIIYGANAQNTIFDLLIFIGAFATFIPGLGLAVRRLQDINFSGWLTLLIFIPILGFIALTVMFFLPGTEGPNKYGPDPKDPHATDQLKPEFSDHDPTNEFRPTL